TFARSGYLRRALDAGVAGYVLKDAPVTELVDALRGIHAGGRVISPELGVAAGGATDPLTDRERDVLRLVGEGLLNREISDRLTRTARSVRRDRSSASPARNARTRTEADAIARHPGLLSDEAAGAPTPPWTGREEAPEKPPHRRRGGGTGGCDPTPPSDGGG